MILGLGGNLKKHIENSGPLPHVTAYSFTIQTLRALVFLHGNGIIHSDLKSQNLLLSEKERIIKLGDNDDCVKLAQDTTVTTDVSMTRGTYMYMSPEMILRGSGNESRVGRKTDIWSLGCVLLNMLTAKPPVIKKASGEEIKPENVPLYRYFLSEFGGRGRPEFPLEVPTGLEDILKQCFQFKPEERPSSINLLESEELKLVFLQLIKK